MKQALLALVATLALTTVVQGQDPLTPSRKHNLRCEGSDATNATKRILLSTNTNHGGSAVLWEFDDPNNAVVKDITHWAHFNAFTTVYYRTDPETGYTWFFLVFDPATVWYYKNGMSEGPFKCVKNDTTTTTNSSSLKGSKK